MNQQGGPIRAEQVHIFLRMPRIGDVHVPQRALIILLVGFRAVCTVWFCPVIILWKRRKSTIDCNNKKDYVSCITLLVPVGGMGILDSYCVHSTKYGGVEMGEIVTNRRSSGMNTTVWRVRWLIVRSGM